MCSVFKWSEALQRFESFNEIMKIWNQTFTGARWLCTLLTFLAPQLHQSPRFYIFHSSAKIRHRLAHSDFRWNLGIEGLLLHQVLWSPPPPPLHPLSLPLVRVDQYFPFSLSPMWTWLFVQTLLCLHKDMDGTALNQNAHHGSPRERAAADGLVDF